MKKSQQFGALALACALVVPAVTGTASAVTPEERAQAHSDRQENRQEARAEHQENREERKDDRAEKREDRQGNHEERTKDRQEKQGENIADRTERFEKRWTHVNSRLDLAVTRLSEAGADTTALESYISTLSDMANDVTAELNALDSAVGDGDKDAIVAAKEAAKSARNDMKSYYKETVRPEAEKLIQEVKASKE